MITSAHAQDKALFLIAGQSNAVGQGNKDSSISCSIHTAFEYRMNDTSLLPLRDPAGENWQNFQRANTGSFIPAFAKQYHSQTGKAVLIISAARGGSSCHTKAELENYGTWAIKGNMPLFENALVKTKQAMQYSAPPLSGVIWSQGERDANAINTGQLTATEYEAALIDLIGRFRKVLGETLPFYIIQTGFYKNHAREGFDEVRKAQERVAGHSPNTFLVYTNTGEFEKWGWMKDEIHYSQQGLNDIGEKMANVIALIEKTSTTKR
ncbi:sialate O-acetylesterase [Terrimonas pollutisoli]|uniref:sialate O-acetylesterase n=1 Tax=Terrimonas pollutisoli TaxID=3034147 RepID=UPI0023EB6A99|nr:sialate O-acetylesterase [Terrimonas sp. H1YJ31]